MTIKAVIFDMDGVVTRTATLHYKAWKTVFEQYLPKIAPHTSPEFTEQDYLSYLDGMPRKEGVYNFLASRELAMNEIESDFAHLDNLIEIICDTKNQLVLSFIESGQVEVFPDTIEFIQFLHQHNYPTAIISSSKNCPAILKSVKIEDLFSVQVDGLLSETLGLPGKPHPAIFLEAAKRLQALPEQCMIIEDAIAGVKAGVAGAFGLVVGLDRNHALQNIFQQLGADYIVSDLSRKQSALYDGFLRQQQPKDSAFQALPLIHQAILAKKEVVIFLDYDGTLTPIADKPEDANLSPDMHQCLTQLSEDFLTVVISGRALASLKTKIDIPTIMYAGNHGFEFEGLEFENALQQNLSVYRQGIDMIYPQLLSSLQSIEGCLIENKKISLSVHYRLVEARQHEFISETIYAVLKQYPHFIRHEGKMVFEIRPNLPWNKGIACQHFLKQFQKTHANQILPIYIGDDRTDEDAFEVFNFNGITIKVSATICDTAAHYFLNSPLDVQNFLIKLNCYKEITHAPLDNKLQIF